MKSAEITQRGICSHASFPDTESYEVAVEEASLDDMEPRRKSEKMIEQTKYQKL
jgi:hypothetical protein